MNISCFFFQFLSLCVINLFHREAIEKEQARQRYEKLHAEGKTDEARADLARLAIIKKQREEASKKKDQDKKGLLLELTCMSQHIASCIFHFV